MRVEVNPVMVAYSLRTYGEDELAARVESMGSEEVEGINEVASRIAQADPATPVPKLLALAAVEAIEGRGRPLSRAMRDLTVPKPPPGPALRLRGDHKSTN